MKPKHNEKTCRTCQEVTALSDYGWSFTVIVDALDTTLGALDKHLRCYAPTLLGKVNR